MTCEEMSFNLFYSFIRILEIVENMTNDQQLSHADKTSHFPTRHVWRMGCASYIDFTVK
jgi:hypothetical protein